MESNRTHPADSQHPAAEKPLIVGIGASAGGLEALQRFFKALPEDNGVAFVVIVHLNPDYESTLSALLQLHTPLRVRQVTGRIKIEQGCVYVIPPSKNLSVSEGHLELTEFEQPRWQRAPIDLFFRSLARVPGGGVGILLSGGGTDGTVGLKTIKEQGGLVMVQEPSDAEHDAMPRSAIATGLVDFILPVEELAKRVIEFRQNRLRIQVPEDTEGLVQDDAESLYRILAHLHSRTGHDLSQYKHSTVLRRIGRRMQANYVKTLPDYLCYLQAHPAEARALLKNLFISVTHFFRDEEAWNALAEKILPTLFQDRSPEEAVRIWVPGCATGEEAYTVAMLLWEKATAPNGIPQMQIFATDLDEGALALGRQGRYPEAIAADVTEERLRRFFIKEGRHYRIKKEVRERVLFAVHSLLRDPPFSKLDLITCRNLLIYLNQDSQENALQLFHFALRPGGFLFLGNAESVHEEGHLFRFVDKKHRIYRRQETNEAPRLPVLPAAGRAGARQEWALTTQMEPTAPSELGQHRKMLEQQALPSLTVSRTYEILHLSDTAGRYLQRRGGRLSHDILHEIRPELRLELQSALHRAFEHGQRLSTQPVAVAFNGDSGWVHLIVQPGREEHGTQDQALVIFAEVDAIRLTSSARQDDAGADGKDSARIRQLEEETQRLRDRLQGTIEEYESPKEEMKAANEALQSMNEEHRSTAEELETVNQELRSKVAELSRANSDLQNLIASTDIGTLFLDRDLRIQRYTPHVTDLFNMMPGDVGRPITHLTHKINDDALVEDAERVLRDLAPVEREIRVQEGSTFLMRMRPYRTVNDWIEGVVITFVDITQLRQAEKASHTSEELYRLLVENVTEYAIIFLDHNGLITTWNVGAERLFGYNTAEAVGQPGSILFTEEDRAIGAPEQEMADAAGAWQTFAECWHVRKDGSRFWGTGVTTVLSASAPNKEQRRFAKVIRDNTNRKQAEEDLRASESRYRAIFENVGIAIYEEDFSEVQAALDALMDDLTTEGDIDVRRYLEEHPAFVEQTLDLVRINDVNEAAIALLGASGKEELLRSWRQVLVPETVPIFREVILALVTGQSFSAETPIRTLQGERLDVFFTFNPELGPAHVLVSLLDVTRQKQAEHALNRIKERLEERVEERTDQVRGLMQALVLAEQGERQRLAQILHDDLQQLLYGLSLTLGILRKTQTEETKHRLQTQADEILDQAARLTKTLASDLSPPVVNSSNLEDLLQWLVLRKKERYDLAIDVAMHDEVQVPARNLRVLLYQALREVLFNIVKHAGVNHARLTAWEEAGQVVVRVEDEGNGFDPASLAQTQPSQGGFGLAHVKERMQLVGGRFHIDSAPGEGTRVTLSVPLRETDAEETAT